MKDFHFSDFPEWNKGKVKTMLIKNYALSVLCLKYRNCVKKKLAFTKSKIKNLNNNKLLN